MRSDTKLVLMSRSEVSFVLALVVALAVPAGSGLLLVIAGKRPASPQAPAVVKPGGQGLWRDPHRLW